MEFYSGSVLGDCRSGKPPLQDTPSCNISTKSAAIDSSHIHIPMSIFYFSKINDISLNIGKKSQFWDPTFVVLSAVSIRKILKKSAAIDFLTIPHESTFCFAKKNDVSRGIRHFFHNTGLARNMTSCYSRVFGVKVTKTICIRHGLANTFRGGNLGWIDFLEMKEW